MVGILLICWDTNILVLLYCLYYSYSIFAVCLHWSILSISIFGIGFTAQYLLDTGDNAQNPMLSKLDIGYSEKYSVVGNPALLVIQGNRVFRYLP